MKPMSRVYPRSAGAAALALAAGLARAHEGHGPTSFIDNHSHGLEEALASLAGWISPFLGEFAVACFAAAGFVLWKWMRQERRKPR